MSSIDNRVVQMEFENREFEKGVEKSKKTLDELDEKLKETGQEGGEGIKTSLGQVNESLDESGEKFNAFEELARGIFIRLGSQIADFGLQLVESLSIDQIAEGYNKYEDVIKNVAGLVNTAEFQGYTYDDVMNALDKLAWYSDATSYSLDAMEASLLTFMNSDIDMNTATDMLMGIGNAFSYAGATATEMDGAFAMLSKAMGSYMTLMQWNSLERVYKVITPKLKEQFLEAGVAAKTLVKTVDGLYVTTDKAMGQTKDAIKFTESEFRTSLKAGWLTSEVMKSVYSNYGTYATKVYEYMQKVTDAGGYIDVYTAMERINEEFEKSKDTLSEVDKELFLFQKRAFESAQEAKVWSEVVDAIKDAVSTQWMNIFSAIIGDYYEAVDLFGSISDFLSEKFVSPLAKMAKMADEWKKLGGRSELLTALGNIINSFDNLAKSVKNALTSFLPETTAEQIYNLTVKFKELTEKIYITEDLAEKLAAPFKLIGKIFKGIINALKAGFKIIKAFYTAFKPIVEMFVVALYYIIEGINKVIEFVQSLGILDNMATQVTYKFSKAKKAISEWYTSFTNGRDIISAVIDELTGLEFSLDDLKIAFNNFGTFLSDFWSTVEEFFITKVEYIKTTVISGVIEAVKKIIGYISFGFEWIKNNFGVIFDKIKTIWIAIRSTIEKGVSSISNFIKRLFYSANEVVGKSGDMFSQYMDRIYSGQTRIERILSILRSFLAIVKSIFDIEIVKEIAQIIKGLRNTPKVLKEFVAPIKELTSALKTMTKSIKANIIKKIAISVLLLAASMVILSAIDSEKMGDVFGYMVQMLIMVAGLVFLVSKSSDNFSKASKTLISLGAAVLLITIAMSKLAVLASNENFGQALGALFAMFTMIWLLIITLGKMSNEKSSIGSAGDIGLMLIKLASGLMIISNAVKIIGELNEDQMLRGVAGIFAVMATMALFLKAMSMIDGNDIGKRSAEAGASLILMSVGLLFMAGAVSIFGLMDWGVLSQGLLAVIILLESLAFMSQQIANNQKQLLALSGSLFIISVSLIALAAGIALIGNIKASPLILGVSTLFIVLAILTSISNNVQSTDLMKVALAVGILGISMIAFAAGLMALGAVPLLFLVKGLLGFAIVIGLLAAAAPLLETAGTGFIKFAAGALLLGLALITIAAGITALSTSMLLIDGEVIAKKTTELISGVCAAIVASAQSVVHAIFSFIAAIIAGLGEGLGDILTSIGIALDSILAGICNIIGVEYTGDIASAISALFGYLWDKIKNEWGPAIWKWLGDVSKKFIDWIWTSIKDLASKAWEWFKNLLQELIEKINNKFKEVKNTLAESGKNIITGLKNGITDAIKNSGVYKTISELGEKIKNVFNKSIDAHSPSKVFQESGSYIVQGLVKGIKDNITDASDVSSKLGLTTISSLKDAISGSITDGIDTDMTITPVLDLSQIEAGTADMEDMLNMDGLSAKVGTMGNIQSSDYATAAQLADMNSNLGVITGTSSEGTYDIAASIKDALNGVGVYADGKKIGKLVTIYQANVSRAGGY